MEITTPQWTFRLGPVPAASGSAYVEADAVKVLAQINGPKEYSVYSSSDEYLRHTQATIELTAEPLESLVQPLTSALESVILLQKYQKSVIEVTVTILEGDPVQSIAYSLLACSLAAIDAGIELRDTMTASTAYIQGGVVTLNQSQGAPDAWLTLGYLPNVKEAVQVIQEGKVSPGDLVQLLQVAEAGCHTFFSMIKDRLSSDKSL